MIDPETLLAVGARVSAAAREALRRVPMEERAAIVGRDESDVIFRLDAEVEPVVLEATRELDVVLLAEGVATEERDAPTRLLMDPIDGTRGLMFEKRSAFFLAGAAPNRGAATRLSDIEVAVMVEIPTPRSHLRDELWAVRGEGARGRTRNLETGETTALPLRPSQADDPRGGFGQISRFFHPGKAELAALEDALMARLYPEAEDGETLTFEDQYASSGGQLYEMLTGKDRFVADLRASLFEHFRREGRRVGHVCHPYDLAAHLIGTEAGLHLTDGHGAPLDAPMDLTAAVDWIGYANDAIRARVEPALLALARNDLKGDLRR